MLESNFTKVFFTLLRSGLWEQQVDDLSCFPITDAEWNTIYKVAKEQTVEGVLYDGVQKLPSCFLPSRELLLTWVVRLNRIEQYNQQMDKCIIEQILFFNKLGVNSILLKGQVLAKYYPVKSHRVCGDIDWYFDSIESSDLVIKILKDNNVLITGATSDCVNYKWKMCEVEQHTKLFDVFNPFARKKLEKIRKERLNSDFYIKAKDCPYSELPPDLNIVQVNLHILKHLLSFGIGLRQLCDSAILYAKLNGKYDKDSLYELYDDVKVLKWTFVLHDLLVKYIGLKEEDLPYDLDVNISSDWMLKDILMTGNFGFYDSKFTMKDESENFVRKNKSIKLWYSFKQYFPFARYEALYFPIVHFLERFKFLKFG